MDKRIEEYLKKKSKAAKVLELLLNREYITGSDIINIYKMYDKNCNVPFTTNPQKFIEMIRKHFGYDFIKDEDTKFFRTFYDSKGKPYKVSDTYKKYFLNKIGGLICQ